jgi:outer membrane protein OmpA-like peptidoglycan-associated protein
MLRLRSLLTGRSVAELSMAAGKRLVVDEIYLTRRGSGELVGHWRNKAGHDIDPHEDKRSGILAAINDVATETFLAEEAALRRIDLESAIVYLRASPAHLLAVKCSGAAPPAMEQEIDEQFIATVEHLHALAATAHAEAPKLLGGLATRLDQTFAEQHARLARRSGGLSPAAILFFGILLSLAGWAAWSSYGGYLTSRARATAESIIEREPALHGYPVHVDVWSRGRRVALVGLVPTGAAATGAIDKLRAALPGVEVADRTSALPGGLDEARQQIAALQTAVEALAAGAARADKAVSDALAQLRSDLARAQSETGAGIETLRTELARLAAVTPEQRLERWTRTHAIFFDKDSVYRDPKAATTALDDLAKLIKEANTLVRVVGHTDEKGGQAHNSPLSVARATKVVDELTKRGVPAALLVAVGRNDVANLTTVIGDGSPNRRVEFEVAFSGEKAP